MYSDSSSESRGTLGSVEEFDLSPPPAVNANGSRVVDDYEIGKSLGKGHFGQVRLARRCSNGDMCALKIIEHKAVMSPRQQELFTREINALSTIRHPNVIGLKRVIPSINFPHEDGRNRQVLILDLELCSGGELFDFVLSGGAFPEPVAKHCFREIVSGLFACHSQGIYHRDLKPENIFISTSNDSKLSRSVQSTMMEFVLKIGDFGLASINELGSSLCKTPVGTRSYQAPEIINHQGMAYDGGKADVWSAGVILFILLVGNPPFVVADRSDWWFNAVRLSRHNDFWKAHQRPPCATVYEGAKQFLNKIFVVDPANRISMAEIMSDPWLNQGDVANDAKQAQIFFNQVSNKSKLERENNLNQAKQLAHDRAIATEVVFAQNVARGASEDLTNIGSISEEHHLSPSLKVDSLNGKRSVMPPSMELNDALSMLHQGVGGAGVTMPSEARHRLFTSTPPLQLLSWMKQDIQINESESGFNKRGLKRNVFVDEAKFKVQIQLESSSSIPPSACITLQIWSLVGEPDVCMVEASIKLGVPTRGGGSETESSLDFSGSVEQTNTLHCLQQTQWMLHSFWYDEVLNSLKSRGCIEASIALDVQIKQSEEVYNTAASSSCDTISVTPTKAGPMKNCLWFPPLPPPRDDDPLFNESLRIQLEKLTTNDPPSSTASADLDGSQQEEGHETTVLDSGHDDLF